MVFGGPKQPPGSIEYRWLHFLNWGNLRHFDTRNERTLTTVSPIHVLVFPVNIVQCHQLCIRQLSSSRISCFAFSMPYQVLHLPDSFSSLLLFLNKTSCIPSLNDSLKTEVEHTWLHGSFKRSSTSTGERTTTLGSRSVIPS